MKIISDPMRLGLSLADKVWNDAMETAALHCEERAHDLYAMNGESEAWVWSAGHKLEQIAKEFRATKRLGDSDAPQNQG